MYKHILIPTDGSDFAGRGLAHGLALAKSVGARVTIVTATEMWGVMEMLRETHDEPARREPNPITQYESAAAVSAERALADAAKQAAVQGIACETLHVPDMHPADAIVATAADKGCDLIVMASHGRRGVGRLMLGSQANEVVNHSKVPTLIVK
jgi:nucleotide-binding universal stress UspA family protein